MFFCISPEFWLSKYRVDESLKNRFYKKIYVYGLENSYPQMKFLE